VLVRDCNAVGYAENILGFPGGGLRYLAAAGGRVVPTAFLSTCNCVYRRAAIEGVGGFSPLASLGGEDSLLAERISARWPCRYAPGAIVYHKPRQRLAVSPAPARPVAGPAGAGDRGCRRRGRPAARGAVPAAALVERAAVSGRPGLSVVLITRNEAARIRACLASVRWAEEIVVVDQ